MPKNGKGPRGRRRLDASIAAGWIECRGAHAPRRGHVGVPFRPLVTHRAARVARGSSYRCRCRSATPRMPRVSHERKMLDGLVWWKCMIVLVVYCAKLSVFMCLAVTLGRVI